MRRYRLFRLYRLFRRYRFLRRYRLFRRVLFFTQTITYYSLVGVGIYSEFGQKNMFRSVCMASESSRPTAALLFRPSMRCLDMCKECRQENLETHVLQSFH